MGSGRLKSDGLFLKNVIYVGDVVFSLLQCWMAVWLQL